MESVSDLAERQAEERRGRPLLSFTLILLTLVYAFNFIDRYILVVMQESIRAELDLSDAQLGMLSGLVFAIFYTTLGIPIARLADVSNRRNIIAVSLTIWSGMTAISGFAQNFAQLALARIGVGVGEAGGSPPAHSMISDMYDEKRRATAIAVYSSGLYLGILCGYLLGGYFNDLFGWRITFFLMGVPGIVLALFLFLFVKEPQRRLLMGTEVQKPSFSNTFKTLWKKSSFRWIALACGISAFASYGIGNFNPSYLARYFPDLSRTEIGLILSLTNGFAGIIGTFMGGWVTDRFGAADIRRYMWIPGISAVASIPLSLYAYNIDNLMLALPILFLSVIFSTFYLAPSIATAHRLVDPRMRAMTSAVLFFVLNLIGLGLGPWVVGELSDFLRDLNGAESLREAITYSLIFVLIKGVLFYRAGVSLAKDMKDSPES